jgi:uncharacterized delta-60 repeat protein
MPAASWFRRWKAQTTRRPAPIERPSARRFAFRPRLEVLEDRHVPAPMVTANLLPAGGALDPSFGTRGVATLTTGDYAFDPTQLADGSIVAPISDHSSMSMLGFRRFRPDGSPDPNFGTNHDGRAVLSPASVFAAYSLQGTAVTTILPGGGVIVSSVPMPTFAAYALQSDNKIVMATQSGSTVSLARLKADGTPDPTFHGGVVSTDIDQSVLLTVVAGDQILLVGGSDKLGVDGKQTGMAVLSRLSNGDPDLAEVDNTAPYNHPTAMVVDPSSGNVIVGDSTDYFAGTGQPNFAVLRFKTTDGTLDTSFGQDAANGQPGGGWNNQVYFLPLNQIGADPLSALALDTRPGEGGIIAVGNYGIVRYTSGGQLDSRFGKVHDGVLAYPGIAVAINHPVNSGGQDHQMDLGSGLDGSNVPGLLLAGVAIQSDGSILLGGPNQNAARLNPDGTIDPTFGQGGVLTPATGGTSTGMVQLGSGATLVGNNNGAITLVRFNTAPAPNPVVVSGQTFKLAASASDPTNPAASFSYQVDWGDGSAPSSGSGAGVTLTHSFPSVAAATPDTIQVTFTDANGSKTVPLTVTVEPATTDGLQTVLNSPLPTDPVSGLSAATFNVTSTSDAANWISLVAPQSAPVALVLNAPGVDFTEFKASVPGNVTVVINGAIYHGGSPALTLTSGNLIITGSTFVNATDAPTILVTGGHLKLRGCTVQESTGYSDPAIQVTGGTVDLGTAADPGGNTINVNGAGSFALNTTSTPITAVGDSFTVNGAPLQPGSLSGVVWEDFNDDGQVDFGEGGIRGVTVTLTGTDYLGDPVNLSQTTDGDGAYVFPLLLPGTYQITETQPAGYLQGIDAVGTAGGTLAATDQFAVPLGAGVNGLNYNFGEQPAATGPVHRGQAAGIGFWNNTNGQALIKALPVVTNPDGSVTSVANWLAATMPNTFGIHAGSNNLTGQSNAYVAALFQQDFVLHGVKLDAQVLATALNVYATNATLDSTKVAAPYGFTVSGDGLGAAAVNVGGDGDAFGVANNTTMTVVDLLVATDAQSVNGVLYNGNATKRSHANDVYSAINQAGGL